MEEYLSKIEMPEWAELPPLYLKLTQAGETEFLPWYLMEKERAIFRRDGLKSRYRNRELFPFARRDDNDDVACWEEGKAGQVTIIHDFASPGWEQRETFENFEEWYKFALSEQDDEC